MSDIGVGDWVECWKLASPTSGHFHIGSLYLVEEVRADIDGLNFHGMPRPYELGRVATHWAASFFRPIYRPKQEIIEALKAPPKRVKERV